MRSPDSGPVDEPPFLDAHVHFWDHSLPFVWGWLDPSFTPLGPTWQLDAPRYTAPEFRTESEGAGVTGMVHINATLPLSDPSAETAWLEGMASADGWPTALVGACELRSPEAAVVLRRHAGHPHLKGIRDLSFSRDLDIDAAAVALGVCCDLDLSVELRVPVPDLTVLGQVARRWPELTVVLGHAGLPPSRTSEDYAAWRRAIGGLAGRPNVVCKISAVGSSADREWTDESIGPWILECVELFGADRCMFGTNWPLDRLWRPYTGLVAAYRRVTTKLPGPDRHALFHGTAERVYRVADTVRDT